MEQEGKEEEEEEEEEKEEEEVWGEGVKVGKCWRVHSRHYCTHSTYVRTYVCVHIYVSAKDLL